MQSFATITNVGASPLSIYGIQATSDPQEFATDGLPAGYDLTNPLILAPNATYTFDASFAASQPGLGQGQIKILTNDPLDPVYTLNVVGTGLQGGTTGQQNNAYVAIEYWDQNGDDTVLRQRADASGDWSFNVSPGDAYHVTVYDPVSGLVANDYGTVSANGQVSTLEEPIFEASTQTDSSGGNIPDDIRFTMGLAPSSQPANSTPPSGQPQLLQSGIRQPVAPAAPITTKDLTSIMAEAISEWAAAGAAPVQIQELRSATYQVASLPVGTLGWTSGHTVTISPNAAGVGWFIDANPGDKPPANEVDLLTVVTHEMGHVLGLPDLNPQRYPNEIMTTTLAPGQQRFPGPFDIASLQPQSVSNPVSGGNTNPVAGISQASADASINRNTTGASSESKANTSGATAAVNTSMSAAAPTLTSTVANAAKDQRPNPNANPNFSSFRFDVTGLSSSQTPATLPIGNVQTDTQSRANLAAVAMEPGLGITPGFVGALLDEDTPARRMIDSYFARLSATIAVPDNVRNHSVPWQLPVIIPALRPPGNDQEALLQASALQEAADRILGVSQSWEPWFLWLDDARQAGETVSDGPPEERR